MKVLYEILQACDRYFHKEDTVSNPLIIILDPLHIFLIENMASYMVAVVRAIYGNLLKAHLMTNSLYFCSFLALILIQNTFTS